jgi:hypothetical protein
MKYSKLLIEYCDKQDHSDVYTLHFKLRNYPIVEKWVNKVLIANKKYSIDDPGRFYGFGNLSDRIEDVLAKINKIIDVINSFETIIDRKLLDIYDQDTLNYLHHIFEIYHGFLQKQTHEYWLRAPNEVRHALATLNILVHRCENMSRFDKKLHTVTWYEMPKIGTLEESDYKFFDDCFKKGTVYLNYTEIGKPFEDLVIDNDSYIGDDAFRPFRHYTADFIVTFIDDDIEEVKKFRIDAKEYYEKNKDFFLERGYYWGHPELTLGRLPVADLEKIDDDLIDQIEKRQYVKSIKFI